MTPIFKRTEKKGTNKASLYVPSRFETCDPKLQLHLRILSSQFRLSEKQVIPIIRGPKNSGKTTFLFHAWRLANCEKNIEIFNSEDETLKSLYKSIKNNNTKRLLVYKHIDLASEKFKDTLYHIIKYENNSAKIAMTTYNSLGNELERSFGKITLPPLSERKCDILYLASLISKKERYLSFSPCAQRALTEYKWTGEYPELANCVIFSIWRAKIQTRNVIYKEDIEQFTSNSKRANYWLLNDLLNSKFLHSIEQNGIRELLKEIESFLIIINLLKNHGHLSKTALALGLPLSSLSDRIRSLGQSFDLVAKSIPK